MSLTTRKAKKMAKCYLDGTLSVPVREDSWTIDTDGTYVVVTIAVLPAKVMKWVRTLAEKIGWDGCWWDDPAYLNIEVFN